MLVIAGPTGVGKSAVAVRVAERLDGEIVGCDALQVYRGFDRATAKPGPAERLRVPHHLIDVADPRHDFSLAEYVRFADAAIASIQARGRVPVIVGGTGLYLRGLLRGIIEAPARDPELRARLRRMSARFGSQRLHRWLARLDPASAERIAPRDAQRVVRAIEIGLKGARSWSEALRHSGSWGGGGERYASLKIALDMDRETHAQRLDRRAAEFLRAGLLEEARALLARGVPSSVNAFKAIGYREALASLASELSAPQMLAEIRRNTRRYAKRQRSWFRGEPGMTWIDMRPGVEAVAERIVCLWRERFARDRD